MDTKTIASVEGLLLLDRAAVEAYDVAIRVCSAKEIADQLRSFKADHERHVRELSDRLRALGAERTEEPGEQGAIIKGYTALASQEDRSALLAMRGNEELTNAAYASALRGGMPDELREMIERNFEDERRHIAWIRDEIITRGWDKEPPEMRELSRQEAA